MTDAYLARIEDLLSGVERVERETGGAFTDPADLKEAKEIVASIERKMIERTKVA